MASAHGHPLLRLIRRIWAADDAGDVPDAALLARFVARQDEAAFASLVRRHGPMVLGVCRRILNDLHDSEDAFQATFLVLASKAGSLGEPQLLGNWLYGVAQRVALKARAEAARRRVRERRAAAAVVADPTGEVDRRELRRLLDEEVNRLPDRYRVPIILCYLEGQTQEEAARRLGCPRKTITSRLARACQRLRSRLSRRGAGLSGCVVAAALAAEAAALPPELVEATVKTAALLAAGQAAAAGTVPARIAALTEGVLRTMTTRLRAARAVFLAVCFLGVCVGVFAYRLLAAERDGSGKEARPAPASKPREGKKPAVRDPLELIRQASRSASQIRSAVGTATFEHFMQEPRHNEKKLGLRTKGKVKVYFDRGRYHLRFQFDTMLQWTTYTDGKGKVVQEKFVEWKPEDLFVIYDGKTATVVTFSRRIRPSGCMVEIWPELRGPAANLPWNDVARLGLAVLDVEGLIRNLGRDAIRLTKMPQGGYRGRYHVKNAPKVRVEFDARPEAGFNVTAERVFNEGNDQPVTARSAAWKKDKGLWYVERLVEENDFRGGRLGGYRERWVFRYTHFEPNARVDPTLFTLKSAKVPDRTRVLDRRPQPAPGPGK
jgi:RNA polymerase sigma factor (sigma-70 family)